MTDNDQGIWRIHDFEVTTDASQIPRDQLNAMFAQHDFDWAKPLSEQALERMISGSTCFGILQHASNTGRHIEQVSQLVGFGRFITDGVTVVYVTDVYVLEAYRSRGLSKFLLKCMNEYLDTMPDLRGTIMIVKHGSRADTLYRSHFAMHDLDKESILLDRKGPGAA